MVLVIIALLIFAIAQKSIPPCCIFFEMLLLRDFNSAHSLISKCNIQTIIIKLISLISYYYYSTSIQHCLLSTICNLNFDHSFPSVFSSKKPQKGIKHVVKTLCDCLPVLQFPLHGQEVVREHKK